MPQEPRTFSNKVMKILLILLFSMLLISCKGHEGALIGGGLGGAVGGAIGGWPGAAVGGAAGAAIGSHGDDHQKPNDYHWHGGGKKHRHNHGHD